MTTGRGRVIRSDMPTLLVSTSFQGDIMDMDVGMAVLESAFEVIDGAEGVLDDLLSAGLLERMTRDERIYAALFLGRTDVLRREGLSSVEALALLPISWSRRLIRRWQHQEEQAAKRRQAEALMFLPTDAPDDRSLLH
jgi:hypothetical protein